MSIRLPAGVLISSNHVPSGSRHGEARFRTLDAVIVRAAVCCHGGFKAAATGVSQTGSPPDSPAQVKGRLPQPRRCTHTTKSTGPSRTKGVSRETTYDGLKIRIRG